MTTERNNRHFSMRLDPDTVQKLASIERELRSDPATGPMLRAYRGAKSRGQIVRWAITRAWTSLRAEAKAG